MKITSCNHIIIFFFNDRRLISKLQFPTVCVLHEQFSSKMCVRALFIRCLMITFPLFSHWKICPLNKFYCGNVNNHFTNLIEFFLILPPYTLFSIFRVCFHMLHAKSNDVTTNSLSFDFDKSLSHSQILK